MNKETRRQLFNKDCGVLRERRFSVTKGKSYLRPHYSPESRIRSKSVIVVRYTNSPYYLCEREVGVIYDRVCQLLDAVETWIEYSDEDIKNETIPVLRTSIDKTLVGAARDIEELISQYQITDKEDVDTLKDAAVQLQEIADDIFNHI